MSEFKDDVKALLERGDIKTREDICRAEYAKALRLFREPSGDSKKRGYQLMRGLALTFDYLPALLWMGKFTETVRHDIPGACRWYQRAADQGHAPAADRLQQLDAEQNVQGNDRTAGASQTVQVSGEAVQHDAAVEKTPHKRKGKWVLIICGIIAALLIALGVCGLMLHATGSNTKANTESETKAKAKTAATVPDLPTSAYAGARWLYDEAVFTKDDDKKYHHPDCPNFRRSKDAHAYMMNDEAVSGYTACKFCRNYTSADASNETLQWLYDKYVVTAEDYDHYHRLDCQLINSSNADFDIVRLDDKKGLEGKEPCSQCMGDEDEDDE